MSDKVMSPESFAKFIRNRLNQGLSVEGYTYTCTDKLKENDMNPLKEEEQKLDVIVSTLKDIKELLEKLTNETTVINAPITVKSEDKNVGVDISEALSKLTKKLERKTTVKEPGKEEFIQRTKEIDWSKILEPKIRLLDEKGKDIGVKCDIQEDGSVICEPMTESRTIIGGSLEKEEVLRKVYKKRLNLPEYILVGDINKRNRIKLREPNKETAPWLVPSLYERDWYVVTSTKNIECNISPVYTSFIPSNDSRQVFVSKDKEHYVTGYLTDDGRAVYYDQYL